MSGGRRVGKDTSFWDVPNGRHAEVSTWLAEPGVCHPDTGFPTGTLLHCRPHDKWGH